jgi:transposase
MTAVVIGIDPHKASHTAVAVDERELALGDVRVRATAMQSERLLAWAAQWPQRTWAIENAAGLGYLLAQQLVMAGERVVDVQPKLAARVRLLASAASSKSDPHDARSVAIVALRSALPPVTAEDHVAVMKVWIRRRRHLSRLRTKVANQLHAVLCELVPGGFPREITAPQAAVLLESLRVSTAADVARAQLAAEILDDLRRLDLQLRELHKRLTAVVLASKTSVTSIFGVGPVIAAMVVGITGEVTRFPTADRFAAYAGTAPIEVSSGPHKAFRLSRRGNRQLNHAIHMAAVTQIRNRRARDTPTTSARSRADGLSQRNASHRPAVRGARFRRTGRMGRAVRLGFAGVRGAMGESLTAICKLTRRGAAPLAGCTG